MKKYRINKKHGNNIVEEATSIVIEANNIEEAKKIVKKQGMIIFDCNTIFNTITIQV